MLDAREKKPRISVPANRDADEDVRNLSRSLDRDTNFTERETRVFPIIYIYAERRRGKKSAPVCDAANSSL